MKGKGSALEPRLKAKHKTTFAPCCEEVGWGSGLHLQQPVPQGPRPAGLTLAFKTLPGRVTATNCSTYKQKTTSCETETKTVEHGLCHPTTQASRGSGSTSTTVAGGPCLALRRCRQASGDPPGLALLCQPPALRAACPGPGRLTAGLSGAPAGRFLAAPSQLLWTCRLSGRRTAQHMGKGQRASCHLLATAAPTSHNGQRGWETTRPSSLCLHHETAESRELQQAGQLLRWCLVSQG